MTRRYHPKYCEENIWWLASSDETGAPTENSRVIFISSATQSCLLFGQREHEPVVWDYHVVLWVAAADGAAIWDLDTALKVPCDAETYLRSSFAHLADPGGLQADYVRAFEQAVAQRALTEGEPSKPLDLEAKFLALDASAYVQRFSSDRQHMIAGDGSWFAPPPTWPCIDNGDLFLAELIHLRGGGRQHDLDSLLRCAAENRLP